MIRRVGENNKLMTVMPVLIYLNKKKKRIERRVWNLCMIQKYR